MLFFTCSSCWRRQLNGIVDPVKWRNTLVPNCIRSIYSETGKWEKKYGLETRKKVESWWHSRIKEQFQNIGKIDVRIIGNIHLPFFSLLAINCT
uniref:Uncharacterized protein n=1 Tax=Anolis carolinensis TaxID=28377 RepID=A0A803TFW6_ANOCA